MNNTVISLALTASLVAFTLPAYAATTPTTTTNVSVKVVNSSTSSITGINLFNPKNGETMAALSTPITGGGGSGTLTAKVGNTNLYVKITAPGPMGPVTYYSGCLDFKSQNDQGLSFPSDDFTTTIPSGNCSPG